MRARVLAAALLLGFAASGDVVRLRNGQKLEGIVVTQTADRITLDVGTGQIHLKPAQVATVERGDPGPMTEAWTRTYFLHPRFVPPSCTNLAAQLGELETRRRGATAAAATRRRLREEFAQREAGRARSQAALEQQQERIRLTDTNAVTSSRAAWEAYAQEVASLNAAVAEFGLAGRRLREIEEETARLKQAEIEYLRALDRARVELQAWPTTPDDPAVATFLARARTMVDGFAAGIDRHVIAPERRSDHALLDVRFNERATGRLILDTGASLVVIGEDFAHRAGMPPDTNRVSEARLADGRVVRGWPIRFARIEVQGARVENVEGVVLPEAPAEGIDGLLGMSFLREFYLRVDPSSGEVEFSRLAP